MPDRQAHEQLAAGKQRRRPSIARSQGPVNRAWCEASLRDPRHLFARMWGKSAWVRYDPDSTPACWESDEVCGTGEADDVCVSTSGSRCAGRALLTGKRFCFQLSAYECSKYALRAGSKLHACQFDHAAPAPPSSSPNAVPGHNKPDSRETSTTAVRTVSSVGRVGTQGRCKRGPPCSAGKPGKPTFWETLQNDKPRRQLCRTNWYAGAEYLFGGSAPTFSGVAPPLFGFDNEMDQFCQSRGGSSGGTHYVQRCVAAGYNQLSLLRAREPYNLCRNVEYQVCAARGLVQSTDGSLVFASRPALLNPQPDGTRGLGWCGGPMPAQYRNESCARHWGNDDIFFAHAAC